MFEDGVYGSDLERELETTAPGPVLGLLLASIEGRSISERERMVLIRAHRRQVSFHQGASYDQIGSHVDYCVVQSGGDVALGFDQAGLEIGAALTLTRRKATDEVNVAYQLAQRPRVADAFSRGVIDLAKTRIVLSFLDLLQPDQLTQVWERVQPRLGSVTTGQLRALLNRLCITEQPDNAETRYQQSLGQRGVEVSPDEDGTATLTAHHLPAEVAQAVYQHLTSLAWHQKVVDGETRTLYQIRADLLLDLALEIPDRLQHRGNRCQGEVVLHVDLATLAGLNGHPGDVNGYGPVIADLARQIAENQTDTTWSYLLSDEQGQMIGHGSTKRRPSQSLRRFLQRLHPTCTFPGCRQPSRQSDLDHLQPYSHGGKTNRSNLAPLCRYHNRLKHLTGWTVYHLDQTTFHWTSPLGHTYLTRAGP